MSETPITPVHQWTNGGDRVMLVRFVDLNHQSYHGFQWPKEVGVEIEAPDWNPAAVCGGGFHAWPWAIGMGSQGGHLCASLDRARWHGGMQDIHLPQAQRRGAHHFQLRRDCIQARSCLG